MENSEPLSVVIVLKMSFQCSLYCERRVYRASMTPFGSRPGTRIIQYSRGLRSIRVSRASSFPCLAPMTRSASQCPNSLRLFTAAGRSSMLRPRIFLCLRFFAFLGVRHSFWGKSIFFIPSNPRSVYPYSVLVQTICSLVNKPSFSAKPTQASRDQPSLKNFCSTV